VTFVEFLFSSLLHNKSKDQKAIRTAANKDLFEHIAYLLPGSTAKIIGDKIYNGQCTANVWRASPCLISFDFSDWNDRRIARTTGKLEQPESREEQKPERLEQERPGTPERRNDCCANIFA
jgi:hypothetical protein